MNSHNAHHLTVSGLDTLDERILPSGASHVVTHLATHAARVAIVSHAATNARAIAPHVTPAASTGAVSHAAVVATPAVGQTQTTLGDGEVVVTKAAPTSTVATPSVNYGQFTLGDGEVVYVR